MRASPESPEAVTDGPSQGVAPVAPTTTPGCRHLGPPRPIRPWRSLAAVVATLLALAAVAHNSGSGWVQAVGILVASALVVGMAGGLFALRGLRVAVTASPSDAEVNVPFMVGASASRRVRITPLDPGGSPTFAGPGRPSATSRAHWHAPHALSKSAPVDVPVGAVGFGGAGMAPGTTTSTSFLLLVARKRGQRQRLLVEVSSAAPFGIMWWSARLELDLPVELVVSPECRYGEQPRFARWIPRSPVQLADAMDDGDLIGERKPGTADEGRAVEEPIAPAAPRSATSSSPGSPAGYRPYEKGDERRRMHWLATAHRGSLMVRLADTEAGPPPVSLLAELPKDEAEAEAEAARVMGTLCQLLRSGTPVMLGTYEAGRLRFELVRSRRQAGRRLARATAPGKAEGWGSGAS